MEDKKNKYNYCWVIQGYYMGWEDLAIYDKKEYNHLDVLKDFREYKIADNAPKRIIERRELNPEYIEIEVVEISA